MCTQIQKYNGTGTITHHTRQNDVIGSGIFQLLDCLLFLQKKKKKIALCNDWISFNWFSSFSTFFRSDYFAVFVVVVVVSLVMIFSPGEFNWTWRQFFTFFFFFERKHFCFFQRKFVRINWFLLGIFTMDTNTTTKRKQCLQFDIRQFKSSILVHVNHNFIYFRFDQNSTATLSIKTDARIDYSFNASHTFCK